MASFLLAAGTPLNYYLDNVSLEEIKPFDHLLVLGTWVSIQFISLWLVKEIIDCCIHLLHAEADGSRKPHTGNREQALLLMSCLWLIFLRDQVLEIIPSNEEQIKTLVQLEAEEHLQVLAIASAFAPSSK